MVYAPVIRAGDHGTVGFADKTWLAWLGAP
jgi:hypothetical protein